MMRILTSVFAGCLAVGTMYSADVIESGRDYQVHVISDESPLGMIKDVDTARIFLDDRTNDVFVSLHNASYKGRYAFGEDVLLISRLQSAADVDPEDAKKVQELLAALSVPLRVTREKNGYRLTGDNGVLLFSRTPFGTPFVPEPPVPPDGLQIDPPPGIDGNPGREVEEEGSSTEPFNPDARAETSASIMRDLEKSRAANPGTGGEVQAIRHASVRLERAMGDYLKIVKEALSPEQADLLDKSQRLWLAYRERHTTILNRLYARMDGSMWIPMNEYAILKTTVGRVEELERAAHVIDAAHGERNADVNTDRP